MSQFKQSSTITLFDLQDQFKKGIFKKPEWQRKSDAWDQKKKNAFKRVVLEKADRGKEMLSGCIIFFYLSTNNKITYISDGLQRTTACLNIFNDLKKEYGDDQAEQILRHVSVSTQLMEYEDDVEAKREFRLINRGTPLTAREEAKSILTDLDNYQAWEEEVFSKLHGIVQGRLDQFGVRHVTRQRMKKHGEERDNFALLIRYLIKDQEYKRYNFSVEGIDDPKRVESIIEKRLVRICENSDIGSISSELDSLQRYLTDQTAFLKSIWDRTDKYGWSSSVQTLTDTMFRIFLHLSVLKRNRNIPTDKFEKFAELLMKHGQGTSNIRFSDGGYMVMGMGDLSKIVRVQERLGYRMDEYRKKQRTKQLAPGYENGHVQPFSKVGEGETQPQLSVENRSLGAKPIPDHEPILQD